MLITQAIGNRPLWKREKTLFLTSRMAPFPCYKRVFLWVEEFDKRGCAVCINTSELEEEVLKALLVATEIHKAIDRPYSTISYRIKSLTMNDELLKGREFEDYVLERMDISNNNKLTLKAYEKTNNHVILYTTTMLNCTTETTISNQI